MTGVAYRYRERERVGDRVLASEAMVLMAVARDERPTTGSLMSATGLSRASVANALWRLRERGLVAYSSGLQATTRPTFGVVVLP